MSCYHACLLAMVGVMRLGVCVCSHLQKGVHIRERPLNMKCLDSSDVFILDLGLELYQVRTTVFFACHHKECFLSFPLLSGMARRVIKMRNSVLRSIYNS